ncbi:hypothetical protein J7E24_13020 [Hymenobacter sp. ISL-91]|uniref:hypothetical protein n=1 Tax=Hymenobacter sp. ISL-91 TaxID=2819151 RepID=UPI001BEA749A|nr:hypothetical protein [Hymenobacter sp. ISL-91]MBT2558713.1 hypothetical protein [Hymenobacter sp. ISL-91]
MKAPPSLSTCRCWPLLLLAAALPLAATAQTAPPDTVATYKHQLGLTASPVLDGFFKNNRTLPLGLLYKRQTKPNQALRLGLVFNQDYGRRYRAQPLTNGDFSNNNWGGQLYVGLERQRVFTKRWIGYAGLDVGVGYSSYRKLEYSGRDVNLDNRAVTLFENLDTRFTTTSVFLRPLLGIRYQLTPYLYMSAEATILANYMAFKWESSGVIVRSDNGQIFSTLSGTYSEKRFRTVVQPVSQLTLLYCFGRAIKW